MLSPGHNSPPPSYGAITHARGHDRNLQGGAHGHGGYRFDLIKDFWEFYAEVIHFKTMIQAQIQRAGVDPSVAGSVPPVDAEIVLQRLQSVLDHQAMVVGRMGIDAEIAQHREARYAMVALADDVFLQDMTGWAGREVWHNNLLEYRMFRSHIAGERVFEMIDRLLLSRHHRDGELARIYLLVLAMGFKGGPRDPERARELQGHAVRLFEFIYNRPPDFRDAEDGLIPQAYEHNLSGRPTRRQFVGLRGWGLTFLLLGGFLVLSESLWLLASAGISEAAQNAINAAKPVLAEAAEPAPTHSTGASEKP